MKMVLNEGFAFILRVLAKISHKPFLLQQIIHSLSIFRGSKIIGQLICIYMALFFVISQQVERIKGLELIPNVEFTFGSCLSELSICSPKRIKASKGGHH